MGVFYLADREGLFVFAHSAQIMPIGINLLLVQFRFAKFLFRDTWVSQNLTRTRTPGFLSHGIHQIK